MQVSGENYNYIENGTEVKVVQTECWCGKEELKLELSIDTEKQFNEVSISMRGIQWPFKPRFKQFVENRWERSVILSSEEFFDFVDKINKIKDYIVQNNINLSKEEFGL